VRSRRARCAAAAAAAAAWGDGAVPPCLTRGEGGLGGECAPQDASLQLFLCVMLKKHRVETTCIVDKLGARYLTAYLPEYGQETRVDLEFFTRLGITVSYNGNSNSVSIHSRCAPITRPPLVVDLTRKCTTPYSVPVLVKVGADGDIWAKLQLH